MTKTQIIHFLLLGLTLLVALAQVINWSLVGAGLMVIAYQAYTYLRIGQWPSISLYGAILDYNEFLGFIGHWVQQSQTWPGLRRALKFMPLSVFFIFCGFFIEFISQGKLKEFVFRLTENNKNNNRRE
ncbi:MAG: hypothetical protein ACC707_20050 [Thiohalomonadales bacterium]